MAESNFPHLSLLREKVCPVKLPALIDCHVHLRTPGHEYKENWVSGAYAAIAGGITHVMDMPNTSPPTITNEALQEKHALIQSQLPLPLRYGLYLGADRDHLEEISTAENCCGLKIFMGSSTGTLLMDDQDALEEAFQRAAERDLLVALHAEDESSLGTPSGNDPANHSQIRPPEAAAIAIRRAVDLAKRHNARIHILHVSSKAELEVIRAAKASGLPISCEACPHHLFLSIDDYPRLGTCGQMNPPLRTREDQAALWEALLDGTIDTIGTDHAPHLMKEKELPYPHAPAGVPGLETLLPLLITDGRLSIERIIELTRTNAQEIFGLEENDDYVIIDLEERAIPPLYTRCGWTPFKGPLKGWPVETCSTRSIRATKRIAIRAPSMMGRSLNAPSRRSATIS